MQRQNISTKTYWESIVGYSRAVRIGSNVYISGTTATDESGTRIIGIGDPYVQTIQAIKNIENALEMAGATLKDVVRTRIYVANIDHWRDIGKAHADLFKQICPATTMVEVSRLSLMKY